VPAAKVERTTPVDIPDNSVGAPTTLGLDIELFDTMDMHAGSAAEVSAPRAGIYLVHSQVAWSVSSTGIRLLEVDCAGCPNDFTPIFLAQDVNS
jgi:hypothetical protein